MVCMTIKYCEVTDLTTLELHEALRQNDVLSFFKERFDRRCSWLLVRLLFSLREQKLKACLVCLTEQQKVYKQI